MANATTTALDEATPEPEGGIELARPWIAALVILLAAGIYLNADIAKRRASLTTVGLSQSDRMAMNR